MVWGTGLSPGTWGCGVIGSDPRPLKRSNVLDAVRGVAILQVLIFHYFSGVAEGADSSVGHLLYMTWSGVDLFFCLSGFLIGGIVIDQRDATNFYKVFYARRALRILPLYIIVISGCVLLAGSSDGIWAYATFTQNFWWAAQGNFGPPGTLVTWSLAAEEQFYLVLPVLVRFCRPSRLPYVLVGLICATPIFRWLTVALYGNHISAYVLLPCRMDALFIGVLIAWAIRQPGILGKLKSFEVLQKVLLVMLWCGFAGLWLLHYSNLSRTMQSVGYSFIALTYGMTLLYIVSRTPAATASGKGLMVLSYLGLGAYSIYLFHVPFLTILAPLSPHKLLLKMIAIVLVLIVAIITWHFIELPLTEFGRRRFRYRSREVFPSEEHRTCSSALESHVHTREPVPASGPCARAHVLTATGSKRPSRLFAYRNNPM